MTATSETWEGANRKRFKVPSGFDPARHGAKFLERIQEEYGEGFRMESFDSAVPAVTVVRENSVVEFIDDGESIHVGLTDGTQEAQGPKIAQQYEALKPGWRITSFRPYAKPGYATMRQLSEREARVRDAVATVLRVARTPWKVQVRENDEGGFDLQVPESYSPTSHDGKLLEVAETSAGEPGWFTQIDPKTLSGKIVPGELPTFPELIPYPFDREVPKFTNPSDTTWSRIPMGRALGKSGLPEGPEFLIDLKAAGHTLVQGTPGSGKSVDINEAIWWLIKVGSKLAITDTPAKSVDFLWAQQYCMDGGWGCATYAEMVTTSELVLAEANRRSKILHHKGLANWFDIDDDPEFVPLVYVVDEWTALTTKTPEPKALDKEHPRRMAIEEENAYKDLLAINVQRLILEMRFTGVFVLLSTQLGNTTTGVTTAMKNGCGNRILKGARPSDRQRANAFSDPDSVPQIPANVSGTPGVSRGVGTGEFEGQPATVFKGYFASVSEFQKNLEADMSLMRTSRPRPTKQEMARLLSDGDFDLGEDDRALGRESTNPFGDEEAPRRGSTSEGMNKARELGLKGAAAANFAGNFDTKAAGSNE